MNHYISPVKTGYVVGAFIGGLHLVWSLLVALGWAQALVDLKLRLHMVSVPVVVNAFALSTAVMLVVMAVIMGYVLGYLFAHIWNRMHRD